MNERIKELESQCWVPMNHGPAWFNGTKFAKLIAKECADVCDLYAMPDGTSETAIILSAAIKRKFGVEE